MSTPRLYTVSAVAAELGVTPACVTNWRRRHPAQVPAPDYLAAPGTRGGAGTPLWVSVEPWRAWYADRAQ